MRPLPPVRAPAGWVLAAGLAALLAAVPSLAAPTPLRQDRGVFAQALCAESAAFQREIASREASDFLNFNGAADAAAQTSNGSALARARLFTRAEGETLQASGSAQAEAEAATADATATAAPTDSFYELIFQAGESEVLPFTGALNADAQLGDGFASVQLIHLDSDTTLATHEAGPGDAFEFSDDIVLSAGDSYRIVAFAVALAQGDTPPDLPSGEAAFSFRLGAAIPPLVPAVPSLAWTLRGGLAALLALAACAGPLRRLGGAHEPA